MAQPDRHHHNYRVYRPSRCFSFLPPKPLLFAAGHLLLGAQLQSVQNDNNRTPKVFSAWNDMGPGGSSRRAQGSHAGRRDGSARANTISRVVRLHGCQLLGIPWSGRKRGAGRHVRLYPFLAREGNDNQCHRNVLCGDRGWNTNREHDRRTAAGRKKCPVAAAVSHAHHVHTLGFVRIDHIRSTAQYICSRSRRIKLYSRNKSVFAFLVSAC